MRHTKLLVDQLIAELTDVSEGLERDELSVSDLNSSLDVCMSLFRAALIGGYQMADGKRA